jgi:hypothetical protein
VLPHPCTFPLLGTIIVRILKSGQQHSWQLNSRTGMVSFANENHRGIGSHSMMDPGDWLKLCRKGSATKRQEPVGDPQLQSVAE